MGTIYRAFDPMLDRPVALKVLRTGADLDPESKERFYREARACARLSHPNIIAVYDLGESGDALFIAMELLSGSDLRRLLKENRLPKLATRIEAMAQVCDALEHAHAQQLVHRDIKPSNIFLCDDLRAKVLDFGIAKLPTSNLTMAGKVLGSPNYMAPEQIRSGKCDTRSDLFSAAIVFFEFLAGAHPFQDEFIPRRIVSDAPDSLRSKNSDVPEAVEILIGRALEKDPEKRIRTAAEFAAGLRSALAAMRATASAPAATPPEPRPETAPVASSPASAKPPVGAQTGGSTTAGGDTAEQRVSEFLRVVGDFDDGIDKRDAQAARAALDRMREIAAADSRFVVAVSDCEARLHALTPAQGIAAAASTAAGPAAALPAPAPQPRPQTVEPTPLPAPTGPVTAKSAPAGGKNGVLLMAGAVALAAIAGVAFVKLRRPAVKERPAAAVQSSAPAAAPAATAAVAPATADLLAAPNASGQRLALLHHGETLHVLALPGAAGQEFTSVRTMDKPVAGYVRTADLSGWSGTDAESAFMLDKLFATGQSGGEPELTAQLEQWNQFIGRFPTSPHLSEANLESARIELALAKLGRGAGKPAADWQPHMERAKQALAAVTGAPALDAPAAELRREIAESAPPSGAAVAAERILRGRVNSLWEAGQYADAMALVDQVLALSPRNSEALAWKNKIRASQEAEANTK